MTAAALSFERGDISVHQVLAAAPGAAHGMPLTRDLQQIRDIEERAKRSELR